MVCGYHLQYTRQTFGFSTEGASIEAVSTTFDAEKSIFIWVSRLILRAEEWQVTVRFKKQGSQKKTASPGNLASTRSPMISWARRLSELGGSWAAFAMSSIKGICEGISSFTFTGGNVAYVVALDDFI